MAKNIIDTAMDRRRAEAYEMFLWDCERAHTSVPYSYVKLGDPKLKQDSAKTETG